MTIINRFAQVCSIPYVIIIIICYRLDIDSILLFFICCPNLKSLLWPPCQKFMARWSFVGCSNYYLEGHCNYRALSYKHLIIFLLLGCQQGSDGQEISPWGHRVGYLRTHILLQCWWSLKLIYQISVAINIGIERTTLKADKLWLGINSGRMVTETLNRDHRCRI